MDTHFSTCETGFHIHNLGLDDSEPCAECKSIARERGLLEQPTDIERLRAVFTSYTTILTSPCPF